MAGLQNTFALVVVVTLGLALLVGMEGPLFASGLGALLLMTAIGTEQLLRQTQAASTPGTSTSLRRRAFTASAQARWVLSTLLVLGAALFLRLPFFESAPLLGLGLLITATLLLIVLHADQHPAQPDPSLGRPPGRPLFRTGPFAAEFIAYVIAFALYSAIYAPRVRSLFSATAIAIVTALLAVELLRRNVRSERQAWLYGAIIGLSLGELTWALNYWIISPLTGGLALLLAFYALVGLAQHALTGRLTRQVGAELGFIVMLGMVVVLGSNMWLR